jgi:dTDP-4-amino-4,6-dideoxygalactose transaminase
VAVNERNYHAYRGGLQGVRGLSLLEFDEAERCNYQYVVVEVEETASGISRDQLLALLQAENVRVRRYFWPGCHRMEPYRTADPNAHLRLPNTEGIADRVLVLPTGEAVTLDAIKTICDLMTFAIDHAQEIVAADGHR